MKKISRYFICFLAVAMLFSSVSCEDKDGPYTPPEPEINPGITTGDDGDKPSFDYDITAWNGETATDAHLDYPGNDASFYHEANSFGTSILVTFNGTSASVESANSKVISKVEGAYVALNMKTNSVGTTEIIVRGTTSDGGLKIYGNKAIKLTLDGADITSTKGPAINNQCNKALFVHLTDASTNSLTDASVYSDDIYYINKTSAEDRKGCFFSEGEIIFSGTGVLKVAAHYKHAIVTDGFFKMRPGVTLVVSNTAKNAIHVKGDTDEKLGVVIDGGLLHTSVASLAGKGIKCDMKVEIKGGKQVINTTGDSEYDASTKDTSSAAGIKADGDCIISGGKLYIKSTGKGGKGINSDTNISFSGGESTIITSGGEYQYSPTITSSPKAVKADGNITISAGSLNVAALGVGSGSEGLDCAKDFTVSGGNTYIYAYDDAVNVNGAANITGGNIELYSSTNDGIDANGRLTISGGTLLCTASHAPESGIDVDKSTHFIINGGTVIAYAGALQSLPSSSSTQNSVLCKGVPCAKGAVLKVFDATGNEVVMHKCGRSIADAAFFFSTPKIAMGTYSLSVGSTEWNAFSVSSKVTTVSAPAQN